MKTIYEAVCGGEPLDFTPFIDAHGHFGPWACGFVPYALDYGRIIAEMDRFGCDMAWMSASEPGYADSMRVKNDYVFDFAEKYPNRIIPYCTLSSNEARGCLAELKRCLSRGPCIGVKMHIYTQARYTLKDKFLQPVFELLAEKKLVYLNHEFSGMETLKWALAKYPDLTFISGHFNVAINALAAEQPNLRDCTCAAAAPAEVENEVKRAGRSDTLLVGSDFSLFCLAFGAGMVAYAALPEQDKRNILGLNALKLLEQTSWFRRSMLKTLG